MEGYEATRVVFSRIQELDSENATKIMGLLLIQDHGDKEMIRLAFGPDSLLLSLVLKARKELGLLPSSPSPFLHRQNSSPSSWAPNSPFYGGDLVDDHLSFLNDPNWGANGHHRRSCSTADLCLGSDASGLWWRSCQRLGGASPLMASVFPNSPTGAMQHSPSSPSTKCINFLLQHQHQHQHQHQNESQRAAAALMLGGDEARYFIGRRSWMERGELAGMVNPGSRQIYLTFPADSTFREEDVSNYFSIYGPVQDVRIPYQQKRMFGFVTFVYSETVKLILAKGNPHFVCDSRVLVKPYKEKGRIPDKYKQQLHQQQQADRVDFSGFSTTTGLDSTDPYELQQLGAKLLLRRKLEEKQHEWELQQAIELQGRRFAGLQLDLNARSLSFPITNAEQSPSPEDQSPSPPTADSSVRSTETRSYFQESVEHNLPDSPFASPTRASFGLAESFTRAMSTAEADLVAASPQINSNGSKNHPMAAASPSTLDMASFNSFFLQMPRFSSGHGAVGM